MTTVDDFLAHHGVKGMKWGVRRNRSHASGRLKKSHLPTSVDAANAHKVKSKAKSHGTKTLTNKELQTLVNRMNLEQQYSGLKSREATKVKKAHNVVKGILAAGATINAAIAFANSPAGKALTASLK